MLLGKRVDFFICTYFDLRSKEIILLAVVLACKASKKDRSVTEAMTSDDIWNLYVSCSQYIAIQTVKNREIEGYGKYEASF